MAASAPRSQLKARRPKQVRPPCTNQGAMRGLACDPQAVSIEPLTGSGAALAGLTFPRYRRFVEDDEPARLALGAWCGGQAVGLALVAWTPELPQARLFSVMVVPDMRRRGIGTGLL